MLAAMKQPFGLAACTYKSISHNELKIKLARRLGQRQRAGEETELETPGR